MASGARAADYGAELERKSKEFRAVVGCVLWWLGGSAVWIIAGSSITSKQPSGPWASDPFMDFILHAFAIVFLIFCGIGSVVGTLTLLVLSAPVTIPIALFIWLAGVSPVAALLVLAVFAAGVWHIRAEIAEAFYWLLDSPIGAALAPVIALFSARPRVAVERASAETAASECEDAHEPEEDEVKAEPGRSKESDPFEEQRTAVEAQIEQLRARLGDLIPKLPSDDAGLSDWWQLVKQRILLNAEYRRNEPMVAMVQQMDDVLGSMLKVKNKFDQLAVGNIESERIQTKAKRKLEAEKARLAAAISRQSLANTPKTQLDIANDLINEAVAGLPPGDVRADLESTQDEVVYLKVAQSIEERLGVDAFENALLRELLNRRGIPIDRLRPRRSE